MEAQQEHSWAMDRFTAIAILHSFTCYGEVGGTFCALSILWSVLQGARTKDLVE
jgi:hypothetical protein